MKICFITEHFSAMEWWESPPFNLHIKTPCINSKTQLKQ